MRNLKRALSLALASVMLMGMMVVGSSAASYPDVDSNDNTEAIAVLNAVEVMIGNENGEFEPDKNVTRNEMAVILAKLILGKDADKYVGTCPFTDVPEWAQKYVAACYDNKIVAGRTESLYDGDAVVTAQEAAAMTLRVLGYQKLEDKGTNWAQPVVAKANEIRLFKDVGSSATAPMNRNQVAQLSLNALKADVVTTTSGSNIDLGEIGSITTDVKYEKVVAKSSDPKYDDQDDAVQQLCEKLYGGDLKLKSNDTDDFNRPATTWQYKKDPVVTAAKEAEAAFTAKTSNANVLKELKGLTYNNKKISVENDVKAIADLTANGKLVEVFVKDGAITDVIEITYAVAKVTNVTTSSNGDVTYTLDNSGGTGKIFADPDKDDTIVIDGSVEKDDIVTYAKSADKKTLYVYPTTTFTGAQKSWKVTTASKAGTIVVDGETYDVGLGVTGVTMDGTEGKFPNSDDNATFYVDQFGFVVKSDAVEASTDYAVVDGIIYKAASGLTGKPYAQANLVLADGTMLSDVKVVKINGLDLTKDAGYTENNIDSAGTTTNTKVTNATADTFTALALSAKVTCNAKFTGAIVSYSEDNGDYTLTFENIQANSEAGEPTFTLKGTVTANNAVTTKGDPTVLYNSTTDKATATGSTVFVVKTDDNEYTPYTGFRSVPTIKDGTAAVAVTVVTDDDGKAELVYIDASADTTSVGDESGDILYLVSKTPSTSGKDGDKVYTAIVNGEKTTVEVKKGTTAVNAAFADGENKLFELTYDAGGYVTKATAITTSGKWHAGVALADDVNSADGVIGGYIYDGSETVIAIEDGEVIKDATVETAVKGDTIWVKVKGDSSPDNKTIDTIYIVKDGEKSLPSGASDDVINAALDNGGSATLPSGGTVTGNVSVGEGSTLTLAGASTVGANSEITVEEGGTLIVKGNVTTTGEVKLNGGTIKIDENAELVLAEGSTGTVEVANTRVFGGNDGKGDTTALAVLGKIGQAPSASVENGAATYKIDAAKGVKIEGGGSVGYWDPGETLENMAKRTGGKAGDAVLFVTLDLSGLSLEDSDKVKIEYVKNGETKTYLPKSLQAPAEGEGPALSDIRDGEGSSKATVVVTEGVTSVIVTKLPSGEEDV